MTRHDPRTGVPATPDAPIPQPTAPGQDVVPSKDPATGPGTTDDPNQADNTGSPVRDPHAAVPDRQHGPDQTNPHPGSGPGTTSDPNQADRS